MRRIPRSANHIPAVFPAVRSQAQFDRDSNQGQTSCSSILFREVTPSRKVSARLLYSRLFFYKSPQVAAASNLGLHYNPEPCRSSDLYTHVQHCWKHISYSDAWNGYHLPFRSRGPCAEDVSQSRRGLGLAKSTRNLVNHLGNGSRTPNDITLYYLCGSKRVYAWWAFCPLCFPVEERNHAL